MSSAGPVRTQRLADLLLPLLLAALVALCYWPSVHGALLWDDPAHVTTPELRSWDGLGRIWTEFGATQQYYPVLCTVFWIEHRLWGDSTTGYHLANMVQHALCCWLLALVVRRLWAIKPAGAAPGADRDGGPDHGAVAGWVAALLFAVHPVGVESVAWITEQKNTLSLLFGLAAVWCYLGFAEQGGGRRYALASLLFLAALGSKTTAAMLPPILLVLLWWRRGTLRWRGDVLPLVPWFVAAVAMGLLTSWVERTFVGAEGEEFGLSLLERVLLAARITWFFLEKLVLPFDRAFFYRRWDVAAESGGWILHLAAAVLVMIGFWLLRKRTRGPLAAWLALGGALFPALGFFNVYPFLFSYAADHFYYLAAAVMAAAVGGGVAVLVPRAGRWWPGLAVAGVALGGALVWGARAQSRLYVDDETLFRANVAKVPDNWMARRILGHALGQIPGRELESLAEFREVLRLKPDLPEGHLGAAVRLSRMPGGKLEAIAHYERAIELRPDYIEALNNLGGLLGSIPGREEEGVARLEQALRFKSDYTDACLNLGLILTRLPGRAAEAVPHLEWAVELQPDSPVMHAALAGALARVPGRMADAARAFGEAVRLSPDSPEFRMQWANALLSVPGRQAEGIEQLRAVLRLAPGWSMVRNNLVMVLGGIAGREREAQVLLEEGLTLDPNHPGLLNTYGILCAQQGRFAEARAAWERALATDPEFDLARQNLQRLEQMGQ